MTSQLSALNSQPVPLRLEHWPELLDAYVAARRVAPFAWGSHDCCQFARGAVEVQTAADPAAAWGLRPYKSARGALPQLARLGGLEALPARAGLVEIPVLLAGRGCLALGENAGAPALGVVVGARVAFAGKQCLEFVPLAACSRVWGFSVSASQPSALNSQPGSAGPA